MDNLTKEQRRLCMSKIRSKNTQPEAAVRKALRELKQKHQTCVNKLPGKPDIVIAKKRIVIFINGCFWHQHAGCKRKTIPKVRVKYWEEKLKGNVRRQKEDVAALRRGGWKPVIMWECQIKNKNKTVQKIKKVLL